MTYYLDASAIVPLFKDEDATSKLRQWTVENEGMFLTSQLSIGETRSSFSREARRGRWDEGTAVKVGKALDSWVAAALDLVILFDDDIKAAASSVRTPFPKLLMPDAIHLAICKRLDLTLVTLDKDLLIIANREGVAAISPA